VFEVHQVLLPLNGVYILENVNTAEMVKDQAWEFLFTLGPPPSAHHRGGARDHQSDRHQVGSAPIRNPATPGRA
jgi:hypothetical protein